MSFVKDVAGTGGGGNDNTEGDEGTGEAFVDSGTTEDNEDEEELPIDAGVITGVGTGLFKGAKRLNKIL